MRCKEVQGGALLSEAQAVSWTQAVLSGPTFSTSQLGEHSFKLSAKFPVSPVCVNSETCYVSCTCMHSGLFNFILALDSSNNKQSRLSCRRRLT